MKDSELIRANYEKLLDAMAKADAAAYRHTSCEYRVYIDSEGAADYEEWYTGDNGHFRFERDYFRVYVGTICHECYDLLDDWWYQADGDCRENHTDEENEAAMEEAIEEITNSYEAYESYRAMIDETIEQREEDERWGC